MTRMGNNIKLQVTDMHTAGEPVRIVTGGYPKLKGSTILERRRDALENHDHLRALMMHEPRGHAEMYGVIPTPPCRPDAVMGVLFMHNSGYSTMCGHATIAMGRYVVDQGIVEAEEGTTRFILECPCGPVEVRVEVVNDRAGAVSFESVASYLHEEDIPVETSQSGIVRADIAYGGAYYALCTAEQLGLDIRNSSLQVLKTAAVDLTESLRGSYRMEHPAEPDLGFLYGTIITESNRISPDSVNHHLCFFAEGQLDRSPTGSGVSARLAMAYAKGEMGIGDSACFAGISGDTFEGRLTRPGVLGDYKAVHTGVSGRAWYSGEATLIFEEGDPIVDGYLDPGVPGQIWDRNFSD